MLYRIFISLCKFFSLCLIDGPSKDPKATGDFIGDIEVELPDISYEGWTEEFSQDISIENFKKIRLVKRELYLNPEIR